MWKVLHSGTLLHLQNYLRYYRNVHLDYVCKLFMKQTECKFTLTAHPTYTIVYMKIFKIGEVTFKPGALQVLRISEQRYSVHRCYMDNCFPGSFVLA